MHIRKEVPSTYELRAMLRREFIRRSKQDEPCPASLQRSLNTIEDMIANIERTAVRRSAGRRTTRTIDSRE